MSDPLDYSDCHVNAYSRYVQRSAASARPHGACTLPFQNWFHRQYQALPGRYVGLNYSEAPQRPSLATSAAPSANAADL